MMEFRIPDFSDLDLDELSEVKNRFLEGEEGTILRNSIVKCQKEVPIRPRKERLPPQAYPYQTMMKIILRCFPPGSFSDDRMSRFSGKTVGLIKERHSHDE